MFIALNADQYTLCVANGEVFTLLPMVYISVYSSNLGQEKCVGSLRASGRLVRSHVTKLM